VAQFEVESEGARYGYARVKEFLRLSPERTQVPCPHQGAGEGRCGGCPWMIGDYAAQLRYKEQRVKHALQRAGLIAGLDAESDDVMRPIWGSERILGYRNRAQFKTDGKLMGFVEEGTHRIADVLDCLVLNDRVRADYSRMRDRLPNLTWVPTDGHKWNFFELDDAMAPGEMPPFNRRRAFRQGNSAQNERMKAWLAERTPHAKVGETAIELFSGSGNLTGVLKNAAFSKILAVEGVEEAMTKLREKGWPELRTLVADLTRPAVYAQIAQKLPTARVLLLDPPREGARGVEKLVAALPNLERVLSVSCDTATFVRDAVAITKQGFRLAEVQPLDLFPHTAHVEILALFTRALPTSA